MGNCVHWQPDFPTRIAIRATSRRVDRGPKRPPPRHSARRWSRLFCAVIGTAGSIVDMFYQRDATVNLALQAVQTPMSLLMGESGCRLAEHARRAIGRASDVALLHRVVAEDLGSPHEQARGGRLE